MHKIICISVVTHSTYNYMYNKFIFIEEKAYHLNFNRSIEGKRENVPRHVSVAFVYQNSLFRSLGGQRRRPGANYRKKFGHVVVFLQCTDFCSALPRTSAIFGASWVPSQLTEISQPVAEESSPIVCVKYSFCDGQVCTR